MGIEISVHLVFLYYLLCNFKWLCIVLYKYGIFWILMFKYLIFFESFTSPYILYRGCTVLIFLRKANLQSRSSPLFSHYAKCVVFYNAKSSKCHPKVPIIPNEKHKLLHRNSWIKKISSKMTWAPKYFSW